MYSCVNLKRNNIKKFKKLNNQRTEFNNFNKDFLSNYYGVTYAQQIIQRNNVTLLKNNINYIGYIWIIPKSKFEYQINSFYVLDHQNIDLYRTLLSNIKDNLYVTYLCEKNNFNYDILNILGFNTTYGTIEMSANVTNINSPIYDENVSIEVFKIGQHETLRCEIQNKAFDNPGRTPLTIEDIYFDESQQYYLDKAAVFIKYNQTYVGYGQVILNNNNPTIVNLGIIREYRNKGLGKSLLYYLMYVASMYNFENVYIKVKSDNLNAINLYLNCGFEIVKEYHQWYLTT